MKKKQKDCFLKKSLYIIAINWLLIGTLQASHPLSQQEVFRIMSSIDKIYKTDDEWRTLLSKEQFEISRQKGTERPFSGQYNSFYGEGIYICSSCGLPLFSSKAKFDSKSGWPSFTAPVHEKSIYRSVDYGFQKNRVEILCNRCDAHLGHVFEDGPAPSGLRYCINSVSLYFVPKNSTPPIMPGQTNK